MDLVTRDLRYALRQLRRTPAFTLAAVLSLALGIGANTTIFSIVNAFLLRPVQATQPSEMVRVYRGHHSPLTYPDLRFFRERATTLTDIIGERVGSATRTDGTEPERIVTSLVVGHYFQTLGVSPAMGRLFTNDSTAPEERGTVVLSHRYWKTHMGGDSGAVGSTIRVNGQPFTIVGIAHEGFTSSMFMFRPDVFFPVSASKALLGIEADAWGGSIYSSARLATGMTRERAQAELDVLTRRLVALDSAGHAGMTVRVDPARGIEAEMRTPATVAGGFLFAVVSLVLLIACANVANLMLARAASRRREIAIRLAIGASRARLVRQLLVESVVIALGGAIIGLVMSVWVTSALGSLVTARSPEPIALDFAPDARVLAFTVLLAVGTAIVFGLVPALHATASSMSPALRDGTMQAGGSRSRLRGALIVAQTALCVVLIASATLFLRSLSHARDLDPGFDTSGVIDVAVDLAPRQLDEAQARAFYSRLVERARALPGAQSAALAELVPLGGSNSETTLWPEGAAEPSQGARAPHAYFNTVSEGYFSLLRIPVLRGREFSDADREGAPGTIVVNETMARRYWPEQNAIGKRISLDGPTGPWRTVVGVVRDTRYNSLGETTPPFMFLPHAQRFSRAMVLHVRATRAGSVQPLRAALPALVRELDAQLPPSRAALIADDMRISLLPAQLAAGLLGAFGALALLLASVGMYGVTSYAVAQRTRELGVRAALGADPNRLVRLVVGGTTRLAALGLLIGIAGALGVGRLVESQLYEMHGTDPLTFALTSLTLAAVALLASWLPARRAARVDPMLVMRTD